MKRTTRRILLGLAAGLLLLLLVLVVGTTVFVSRVFSHRVERQVATPEELGLEAVTIALESVDGVSLKAWWAPVPKPCGVVIVLHGMDGLDASGMLGHARFLHDAGYAALVLDMRAHGRSGGERIGLAFLEPLDVAAALNWIGAQPELQSVPVALLGVSMGGATALRTTAFRPDVDAVISVSAFSSMDAVIGERMRAMGAPNWLAVAWGPLIRLAMRVIYRVSPTRASPLHDVVAIPPRPILLIHGDADSQVSVAHAHRLYEALQGRAESWIVPGAEHLVFRGDGTGPEDAAYRARILSFLEAALGR